MTTLAEPAPGTTLHETQHHFTTWDGVKLFYRAWMPAERATRCIFLVHRGHEHSARLADVVHAIASPGTAYFAWDARGHGNSPGPRGFGPSFGSFVRDLDSFVKHVRDGDGFAWADIAILGHSVGAVIAATYVHDYAPPIRALVLATPALRVRLYVPLAIPSLRMLLGFKRGKPAFIKSYVKSKLLTHDPAEQRRYDEDKQIERAIAVNVLVGLHDAGTRLLDDAGAITAPTLVLSGGSDWVVSVPAQRAFYHKLGTPLKKHRVFDGMYHDILHEKDRRLVMEEIKGFLDARFAESPQRIDLHRADERGHTKDEYDRLRRPLPVVSLKRVGYAAQRLGMHTLGRLSEGVRVGWRHGFDSGKSLDYVYDNKARGSLLVGKLIDRSYLDAIGWRGIRERRVNLRALIFDAIRRSHRELGRVHVVELACGCGRYTLEALRDAQREGIEATALLRDYNEDNILETRRVAEQMGVRGVTCEVADAFDEQGVTNLSPPPTVAIVSGLYELFPSNEPVLRSLRGLGASVETGGYFVYTTQPWHPQVEMIARTLPNREGQPWIMRRRTQAEMDQLISHVGFEKLDMIIDDHGMFSVALAHRTPRTTP